MMEYYQTRGVCYVPLGGRLPEGASPAAAPFTPLVFLVDRVPRCSRGIFAVDSPEQLAEPEGPSLLLPSSGGTMDPAVDTLVRSRGACVLNTAFSRCFSMLERFLHPQKQGLRLTVVGLGDVGGTVLTGLTLLGECISEIGIFDFYEPLVERYVLELNQVLPTRPGRVMPRIVPRGPEALFDCDVFLFTASQSVPPVGSAVEDVRMAQYGANRALLKPYARQARDAGFSGLFCQISDPVDHLARYVLLESNRDEDRHFDGGGLLPEQVQGFGLGVMEARARDAARREGVDFSRGAVYGPHGRELIAANDWGEGYDDDVSRRLSRLAAEANLSVRALGFKPYIAPGLSSAAISILAAITGQWHPGAVALDGAYFGCRSRMTTLGLQLERQPLHPDLFRRIQEVHRQLKEFDVDG